MKVVNNNYEKRLNKTKHCRSKSNCCLLENDAKCSVEIGLALERHLVCLIPNKLFRSLSAKSKSRNTC